MPLQQDRGTPRQDGGYPLSNRLRHGRCAYCGHAGGLSCFYCFLQKLPSVTGHFQEQQINNKFHLLFTFENPNRKQRQIWEISSFGDGI